MLFHSKAPKTQQVTGRKHIKKTSGLFYGTKRALTLAPEIILITSAPLQKFLV